MSEPTRYVVTIPMATKNPLNCRQSWRPVARRAKANRKTTWDYLVSRFGMDAPAGPLTIRMVRIGLGRMDEGCGLNAALKPVRDGIADWLKLDDADPRLTWRYAQERAERGEEAVRVEIEQRRDTLPSAG